MLAAVSDKPPVCQPRFAALITGLTRGSFPVTGARDVTKKSDIQRRYGTAICKVGLVEIYGLP